MSRYITLFNASDAQAIAEKIYSRLYDVHPESGVHAVLDITDGKGMGAVGGS